MLDFSTYVCLVNETDYTMTGSESASSGHSATIPVVQPHSAVSFQSNGGAPGGTEGTFQFRLSHRQGTPELPTWAFAAKCPHLGDNYFKLTDRSPYLTIEARFANEKPTADKGWGTTQVPPKGHPLGIQLTIKPSRPSLRVVTYNTHLFLGSWLGLSRKDLCFDKERAKDLVVRLKGLAQGDTATVICLQEVWAEKSQEGLAEVLADTYPYSCYPETPTFRATSGLLMLSSHLLENKGYDPYPPEELSDRDMEKKFSMKGFVWADMLVPQSALSLQRIRVITTHASVDWPLALKNLDRALKKCAGPRHGILAGDLNVHLQAKEEHDALTDLLRSHNVEDVVIAKLPRIEDCYTNWPAGNGVSKYIAAAKHQDLPNSKDRIDYVCRIRPQGEDPGASAPVVTSVQVPRDWQVDIPRVADSDTGPIDDLDLSDHWPVVADFALTKKP